MGELHYSQGQLVGANCKPRPGEAAATGQEGGPETRVRSSAGQSSLLDRELKVRVRGGSDRGGQCSRH